MTVSRPAFVGLGHRVVGPHDVDVVAGTTDEGVLDGVGPAIQRIVSGPAGEGIRSSVAGQHVGKSIAGTVDRAVPVRIRFSTIGRQA